MSNPVLSIITICYNSSNDLEKTILSIINQTYTNIEYIIVDGGSRDGSLDVIKKYEKYISKWVSEPDEGVYDAMNKAIRMASGEWINMMNAGDVYHSNIVLQSIFDQVIRKDTMVLYSDHYGIMPDGQRVFCKNDMISHVYGFNHQSIIYRRKLHEQYGYYINNTQKLIISDTLFFAPIPDEQKEKVNVIIADYQIGGASTIVGLDIYKQNLCAEFIFKNISFSKMLFMLIKKYIRISRLYVMLTPIR